MTAPSNTVRSAAAAQAGSLPWRMERRQLPSFRFSDLWNAPIHDFPIRDEILYQCLILSKTMSVLEIGPGSGFTAFRMSREVHDSTLVDLSEQSIGQLEQKLKALGNLSFVAADICNPNLAERVGRKFDVAFALAVFDVVPDPAACLKNLSATLKPGGRLLLQFPNYPPPKGRAPRWFVHRSEIDQMLCEADFDSWEVFALKLSPLSAFIFEYFHETPIRLLRRLRRPVRNADPTKYETTWAYQRRQRLQPMKFWMHSLWSFLLGIVHLEGECFRLNPLRDDVLSNNLLILAKTNLGTLHE
jgi:SAM-dependent methyltransferase